MVAMVEAKRFLGQEFLTWLVRRIEEGDGRVNWQGEVAELSLGDRVVLESPLGVHERLTLVGPGDMRAELGAGLRRGKLVDRARLLLKRGERQWELTLDGSRLTYDALRCPKLGSRNGEEDERAGFETDLFLRVADVEEAIGVLDELLAEFFRLRASGSWQKKELPVLRAWADSLR